MRNARLWRRRLGVVEKTVIETMEMDGDGVLVFSVRATGSMRHRCGRCQRRCPRYDLGDGRRRWRSLDSGSVRVELEADSPRMSCGIHGVSVVAVPWARHGSGHTHHLDAQVAWLATQTSKTAITQLMRIAWRRVGIDEISYKRGHKYLTVVVDHDSGRWVWAAPG